MGEQEGLPDTAWGQQEEGVAGWHMQPHRETSDTLRQVREASLKEGIKGAPFTSGKGQVTARGRGKAHVGGLCSVYKDLCMRQTP